MEMEKAVENHENVATGDTVQKPVGVVRQTVQVERAVQVKKQEDGHPTNQTPKSSNSKPKRKRKPKQVGKPVKKQRRPEITDHFLQNPRPTVLQHAEQQELIKQLVRLAKVGRNRKRITQQEQPKRSTLMKYMQPGPRAPSFIMRSPPRAKVKPGRRRRKTRQQNRNKGQLPPRGVFDEDDENVRTIIVTGEGEEGSQYLWKVKQARSHLQTDGPTGKSTSTPSPDVRVAFSLEDVMDVLLSLLPDSNVALYDLDPMFPTPLEPPTWPDEMSDPEESSEILMTDLDLPDMLLDYADQL